MEFIKNHLSFILIFFIFSISLLLLYRLFLKSEFTIYGINLDNYIQLSIFIVLFLTFIVLSGNLLFLRTQIQKQQEQIKLTQILNRPICGVTRVNFIGNPESNSKDIKTDIDQRIAPSEYCLNFIMLNSGKYPAYKVEYNYECSIVSTNKKIISGPFKSDSLPIVILPGQEIETGFYINKKTYNSDLKDKGLFLRIEIRYENNLDGKINSKIEKYTCFYQIGVPATNTNMIHVNLISSNLEIL